MYSTSSDGVCSPDDEGSKGVLREEVKGLKTELRSNFQQNFPNKDESAKMFSRHELWTTFY